MPDAESSLFAHVTSDTHIYDFLGANTSLFADVNRKPDYDLLEHSCLILDKGTTVPVFEKTNQPQPASYSDWEWNHVPVETLLSERTIQGCYYGQGDWLFVRHALCGWQPTRVIEMDNVYVLFNSLAFQPTWVDRISASEKHYNILRSKEFRDKLEKMRTAP